MQNINSEVSTSIKIYGQFIINVLNDYDEGIEFIKRAFKLQYQQMNSLREQEKKFLPESEESSSNLETSEEPKSSRV